MECDKFRVENLGCEDESFYHLSHLKLENTEVGSEGRKGERERERDGRGRRRVRSGKGERGEEKGNGRGEEESKGVWWTRSGNLSDISVVE